jgi:hypothetical protein
MDLTGRENFVESWLTEMPSGIGPMDNYDQVVYCIKDRVNSGSQVIDLGNGLKKITGIQTVFYWIEGNKEILLGTELYVKPQSLVVSITGKKLSLKGKPPFASDLYLAILKDNDMSIRIVSDVTLSDEGYNLWKRLFNQGCKVSLYDKEHPGQTFKTFDSLADMDQYFKHDDSKYKRYQYVLSEVGEKLAESRSYFNIRRYREIAGLL